MTALDRGSRVTAYRRLTFAAIGVAALATAVRAGAPEGLAQTTAFAAGREGYHTYRIPAAVVTRRGTLLVFAEGRRASASDTGEINVVVKRSNDGGRSFGAQRVVWADGPNTCGNPCAVVDEATGTIWLLLTHNLGSDGEAQITAGRAKGTRTVWVTSSDDDGETWARPREITRDVKKPEWAWYATGPGVGIQLRHGPHRGRLVIPCDHTARGGGAGSGNAHVIYSDDHGRTWRLGGAPAQREFNESQVVELADGRLLLNMRNARVGGQRDVPRQRGVAISGDGGEHFDDAYRDAALIEPICQASLVRFTWPGRNARSRILFSNPASTTERAAMTVRVSYDEGKSWPIAKRVFAGPCAYSCLVPLPDGAIGLLYEAGDRRPYERIDFARMSLEWLTDGKDRLGREDAVFMPTTQPSGAPAR